MLTRKQHELLVFLVDYETRTGYCPSFDEMRAELGLKSKSGINRLLSALVERGAIRRHKGRARAVEVIRKPGEPSTPPGDGPVPAPPDGNLRRYQALDDLLHRHYAMAVGHDADTIASKALHWIAVTAMQASDDSTPGTALRRLSSALMNAANEQIRQSAGVR